jgi:predicted HTH transcriptional regulator
VVGVEDQDNEIVGLDFDDSHIQNLVNAYLENPPKIQYENVPFPNLPKDRVIGLVTVKPKITPPILKGIHTILNSVFIRHGSNTMPTEEKIKNFQNSETVISIENNARNNIKYTLDGVFDFMNFRHKDMAPQYKVFKELFVICWAGTPKKYETRHFFSC